jgi:uncharacterized protein YlxW (UPF0749 family)
MTIDERFARIEHYTAGMAEERKRDREDDRRLWRDTQRQVNELTIEVRDMGTELRESDLRLGERLEQLAKDSREDNKRLTERIENLVSAIGEFLRSGKTL